MASAEHPDGAKEPSYPAELACDVRTAGGAVVHLRPIRPDDGASLVGFHSGLSARSVYRRFFSAHPVLSDAEVTRFTHVDYLDRLALVALDGDRLVAVGRYERRPGTDEAEVAFVVADEYQHHGIGTLLLEHLADAAWNRGITEFAAETLSENHDMLHVFYDSGFAVRSSSGGGISTVRFRIEPDEHYLAARAARQGGIGKPEGEPTSTASTQDGPGRSPGWRGEDKD
jgi:GNAT superfamily N-acetyltransferase